MIGTKGLANVLATGDLWPRHIAVKRRYSSAGAGYCGTRAEEQKIGAAPLANFGAAPECERRAIIRITRRGLGGLVDYAIPLNEGLKTGRTGVFAQHRIIPLAVVA